VDRIFIGLSASSLIYPDRLFLHPPDRARASFKGCWWLAYGSLQLMHVMWQPCCSSRTSNGGLKEDKSYYIAHNLATSVTFDMWAFPKSYAANDSWIRCSSMMADTGKTKSSELNHQSEFLHNVRISPWRWSRRCSKNLCRPFLWAVRFLNYIALCGTFFSLTEV